MTTIARRLPAAILACLLSAAPAWAQAPACPLPYKTFEFAVTHLDLPACPAGVEAKGAFCRATIGGDALHVFVFAEDGDQCLRAVRSYESGSFGLQIK